jgi:menaquinone-dependent protoporphyrinogen IX oxidase
VKKILVAYATNAGSTADVASAVGEELGKNEAQVKISQVEAVTSLEGYDAVVVGAPMIMGWHRDAIKFLKRHRQALSKVQVAYFLTAMRLTASDDGDVHGVPVYLDPGLAKPPQNPTRLSFKERYARVGNYLKPVLKAAPGAKPLRVGFFGGKLNLFPLSLWQKLFVILIVQAQPGEYRNWSFIREWAAGLREEIEVGETA